MPPISPPDDSVRQQAAQLLAGVFARGGVSTIDATQAAAAYVDEASRMLASGTSAAAWREDLHPRDDHGKFTGLEEGSGGRHAGPGTFEHVRSIASLADEIDTASRAAGTTSETANALRNVAHHVALRQVGVAKVHMDDALRAARRERVGTGVMRQLRAVAASLGKIPAGTSPEPGFGMHDPHRTPAPPSLQPHRPAGPGYFPQRVHQAARPDPETGPLIQPARPATAQLPRMPGAVVQHHPACPASAPHASVTASGHLLACHTTPQEAQALALHLDISDATAAPGWATADSPAVTPGGAPAAAGPEYYTDKAGARYKIPPRRKPGPPMTPAEQQAANDTYIRELQATLDHLKVNRASLDMDPDQLDAMQARLEALLAEARQFTPRPHAAAPLTPAEAAAAAIADLGLDGDAAELAAEIAEWNTVAAAIAAGDVAAAESAGWQRNKGNAEHLREYWTHGEGGTLKIRWGTDGDFMRCVHELEKYIADPKGYCNERHHDALGFWPAQHAKMDRGGAASAGPQAAFDPAEPRGPHGEWSAGGGVADVRKRLDEIPGYLGAGGQIQSPADRRLAATAGGIKDELAEGPEGADWEWIRGKMGDLGTAQADATRRGELGDPRARALAVKLGELRAALEGLAGRGTAAAFDPGQARDWHGRWSAAGGGSHGHFPAGQIRKGHHVVLGGKIWNVDRVQHAPGDPQHLIQLHMTNAENGNEHISPAVHPDRTTLLRVEPAEPDMSPREAQQYAGFLPPGVHLSEATQAQLKQARRSAQRGENVTDELGRRVNPAGPQARKAVGRAISGDQSHPGAEWMGGTRYRVNGTTYDVRFLNGTGALSFTKAGPRASADGPEAAFNPRELRDRLGEWSHGGNPGKGKGTGERQAYSRSWSQLAADIGETRSLLPASHPAADYLRDAQHSAGKESRKPGGTGMENHAYAAEGDIEIAQARHESLPGGTAETAARIGQHLAAVKALREQRRRLFPEQVFPPPTTRHAAAPAGEARIPSLVTIPGVDLLAAGSWNLSTGRQTFTPGDLQSAVEAMGCPAVGEPVIKIGHLDKRFAPGPGDDGEPTIGRVTNMRIEGAKLRGDLAGMPGWLGAIAPSAYPRRSVEGKYRFQCQIGHRHPFVVTAVALLGVTPPGVGVLGGLDDIAALYGMPTTAAASGDGWRTEPTDTEESTVPISEEDVRRAYYAAGVPQSYWITELQMTPTQLIVADEQSGKLFRVPFAINGSAVTFGSATELASYAEVAAGRGQGPVAVWASAAESRAVLAAGWDGPGAVRNLGDDPPPGKIKALFALPGDSKSSSSLPHHDVSGDGEIGDANPQACRAAIAALNGARGGLTGVSASEKKTAYNHLAAHLRAAGQEPPDFNAAAAEAGDWEVVEAARTGGAAPSSENPSQPSSENPADMSSSDAPPGPHGPFNGTHTHAHSAYGAASTSAAARGGMSSEDPSRPSSEAGDGMMHSHEHTHNGDATHDHHTASAAAGEPAESHDEFDGEHTHPHAAYGSQGGDQTHSHKHRHSGDAVHRHVHDPVSAAPQAAASTQGGSDVEFTDDQMAAIRQRLGKKDGEAVTSADIAAVFASPTVAAAAGGEGQQPGDLPVITPGTYLVDGEVIRDWQARAAAGDHSVAKLRLAERDTILAEAMGIGKFPQSRLEHYRTMWDRDPDGTRRHVEALAAGLVPVGSGPAGKPGFDAELGEFEGAQAYEALYPEDLKGGVSAAPGIPRYDDFGQQHAARQGGASRG